ncbi:MULTISPECIES: LysE family translocator [Pseudonocardia]|uniref:Homoserine/homoserine lactone efflux protein n=2 Tax=Pseudonocardia TaxID=1847 RepID=A0A1Y2MY68_PSEAH|nr:MULTISPECIES: LysE family transporter [Pseudonocardia]OSY39929.1 Homoserine/homoserine lactone efflux protein [Pseudonocardia autotrophica]TDN74525.1 threonine/homoserine/homoserine lactone efflux protein [Pseudonocardia autotrophica]BBG05293.1 lysine transporter LysE [Pseudonocardia autotrophica]GEC28837.1 lysine transporter LysE [Pseudonocardia saturnea]
MAVQAVVAFWGLSLLLVLTPGADWAYVIGAGLAQRTVLPAVAGLLAGHLALTGAVAAGVAALVAGSPATLTVLTGVGAAYLIWLGLTGLARPAGTVPGTGAEAVPGTGAWLRQAAKGAGTSGLNPKALLLFLTLLPRFTDPSGAWPVGGQILLLGAVHVACCGVVYLAVGIGSRRLLAARPAWTRVVSRVSGGAMVAIGAGLLVGQLAL